MHAKVSFGKLRETKDLEYLSADKKIILKSSR
jgi:hypothetical protein